MNDKEFAASIASAFQPGMARVIQVQEAEDRLRISAQLLGLDPDELLNTARFRYVGGTRNYLEVLEDVREEAHRY